MALTHEQFIERLKESNPTIKVIGTFSGISKNILVRCPQGHEWAPLANAILRAALRNKNSNGCPICSGKKKKTHDEFVNELKLISPNITVTGKFQSVDKKVEVQCKNCNHQWSTTGNSLLRGSGCLHCGFEKMKAKQRKPIEQFQIEAKNINSAIELLGEYKNTKTPIPCRCKNCQYEWQISPSNLLRGKGCPRCAGNLSISHDEFITLLNKTQPEIRFEGTYKSNKTRAPCECLACGWKWNTSLYRLLKGRGCPQCAGVPNITPEFFKNQIAIRRTDISVLGEYTQMRAPILCRCNSCSHEWEAPTQNIWKNVSGCPACAAKRIAEEQRKTFEQFMIDFENGNKDFKKIKITSNYHSSSVKLDAQCLACNHIWHPMPSTLIRGSGCPVCNSAGYDIMKPGIFYLYEIDYLKNKYWGYGISNQYEFREKTHIKNLSSNAAILENKYLYFFQSGKECLELETKLKKHLKKLGLAHNLGIEGFITECAIHSARNQILEIIDSSNAEVIGSEEEIQF